MAVLGIGAILVMLFLLGLVVAVIAIGMAVAHGRFGLALLTAAGAVVSVGIVGALLVAMFAVRPVPSQAMLTASTDSANAVSQTHVNWNANSQTLPNAASLNWHIPLFPGLIVIIVVAFILVRSAKHHFAHAAAGGHVSRWAAVIAIGIVIFLVLGRVSNDHLAQQRIAEMHEMTRVQAEAAAQQQVLADHAAEMSNDIHARIDKLDIKQLMDEFDAPRIMLQVPLSPSAAPAALIMAAAPKTLGPVTRPTNAIAGDATENDAERSPSKSKSKARAAKTPRATTVAKLDQTPVIPEPPSPPSPSAATAPPAAPAPHSASSDVSDDSTVSTTEDAAEPRGKHIAAAAAKQHQAETSSNGKPAWINNPPKRTGKVRREVIQTDEYATADECYRAADFLLLVKTYDHVRQLADQPYQEGELPSITFRNGEVFADGVPVAVGQKNLQWIDLRPQYLSQLGVTLDYIRRELVAKNPANNETCEFLDTIERSVGPMKKVYMELEFTPATDRDLAQKLDAFARRGRFKMVGLSSFLMFGLLFTVWGLLKVDTATKGYYSKWLFVGVPAAIIGTGLLTALVIR